MVRREFNDCLNQERKIYNFSVTALVCAALAGVFFGIIKGMLWGFVCGAVGFGIGSYVGAKWFKGDLQRLIYWHSPIARLMIGRNLPPSWIRKTM